jgi:DNA-binding response OmpR family regulator
MTTILIVEDEQHLADGLRFNLEAEGFTAVVVETAEEALERLSGPAADVDLLVLDVMLPGMSGFDLLTRLRAAGQHLPVLILTARGHSDDIVHGFETGADDYLAKPFELSVLMARIQALLRRRGWDRAGRRPEGGADRVTFAGREIDFRALELRRQGRILPLTLMEANLLRYLVERDGEAVSRKQILDQVWGVHEDTDTRAIDNFIVRLRRYLEDDPARPRHLLTVRGVGYRFVAAPPSRRRSDD